jgi:all-trans-retinol 13,14-reductase
MWDAIVIGSGIGGLGAAAALGKHGKRVLLLEQHTVPGGQTQTFKRKDWEFATGVHYLAGVGPRDGSAGQFGRLLSWLSDGQLQFAPCANPYDIVHLPGFQFGIPHPRQAFQQALLERFPQDAADIDAWFDHCREANRAANALMAAHNMPAPLGWGMRLWRGREIERWQGRTLADELEAIRNPLLRAVLGARWGDHGGPPQIAPFIEHALVVSAYNGGAWYPVGGPARFAQTLLPAVTAAGGECRLGAEVRRILTEGGKVSGVEVVQQGEARTEHAPHVISDIGLHNTLACLDATLAPEWREQAAQLEFGPGMVCLYLGLEGDIAAAGMSSANHWIFESEDIGRLWRHPADEDAPGMFVAFSSLKDPARQGPPTAEVVALVDSAAFAPWLGAQSAQEDYQAFKAWVADRLLAQFKRHFPALAPMVRLVEAATPLTQRRFTHTPGGAIYGLEMSPRRLDSPALRVRSPVAGLWLAGQDVMGPGVPAAFMGGLLAAAMVDARVWRDLGR